MDPDSGFSVMPICELVDEYGKENVQALFSTYRAVYDSDTESFLRDKAIEMDERDLSRTYVAVRDNDMKVLGFVSLSIKCITIPEENLLSGKTLKRMNIEERSGVAQSYLLGQLSRSSDAPGGFGKTLIDIAFDRLSEAKALVGCRMVRLDCHDELIPYYEKCGFRPIRRNEGNTLNQMMAFI